MADNKPLLFPHPEPAAIPQPEGRKSKLISGRTELLIVYGFIAISTYLTVKLALQTSRLADFNTLHERSITLINQQLKDQEGHLSAFERTDHEVLKSLHDTSLRNGRIETRLGQIEDDHMALKRANAHILASEQKLREQLDTLNARMAQDSATKDSTTTVEVPMTPSTAAPANHTHQYASGLTPPPGTQVYTNPQNEQIWQISKDGKQQQLRPIEQTSLGYLVHNLTDGQDYTLTPKGDWLPGLAK